jgi:hypothetical protein
MAQVMFVGILVVLYMVYLVAGIHWQFAVGWVDWYSPFLHYAVIESGKHALPAFVAPLLVLIWLGYLWYQKSMIGEA